MGAGPSLRPFVPSHPGPLVTTETRPGADVLAALEAGLTLPAAWYGRDRSVYERELERIFAPSWQYAARVDQVAEPGSSVATRAGHVPIAVVRQQDGGLRAFVRAAPRADREPGFDLESHSLLPASVDSWGPFVFVSRDPCAAPLGRALGRLPEHLAGGGVDLERLRFYERTEWTIPVNWKLGIENYLECYHCAVAHPGLSKLLDVDPDAYVLEAEGPLASQFGPLRPAAERAALSYRGEGEVRRAQFHFVWPNLTVNVEPGPPNLSLDVWLPAGPRELHGWTDRFFGEDVSDEQAQELVEFVAQVDEEDRALVESVQQGLDSGLVPHGRLLPESEQLIRHFQRLVYDSVVSSTE